MQTCYRICCNCHRLLQIKKENVHLCIWQVILSSSRIPWKYIFWTHGFWSGCFMIQMIINILKSAFTNQFTYISIFSDKCRSTDSFVLCLLVQFSNISWIQIKVCNVVIHLIAGWFRGSRHITFKLRYFLIPIENKSHKVPLRALCNFCSLWSWTRVCRRLWTICSFELLRRPLTRMWRLKVKFAQNIP